MVSTTVIHVITRITTHLPTRRDGRLSWPSWSTHSGRLTHEVVTRQPGFMRGSGKVRQLQTDVLTTEPRRWVLADKVPENLKQNVNFMHKFLRNNCNLLRNNRDAFARCCPAFRGQLHFRPEGVEPLNSCLYMYIET